MTINDTATAQITIHKNLGNTRIAYKPWSKLTHSHLFTRSEKKQVAISDTATHKPQEAKGPKYH